MNFRALRREPLVHFLLLGAALFVAYGWLNRDGWSAPDAIVVSRSQAEGLALQFERVWQRRPSAAERQALIDSWVRDEIFYREAVAMGLDQDDPVVRRRMSQKIQFIVDTAAPETPAESDLQRWLAEHVDDYRIEATYSIRQVYFDPARHGDRLDRSIALARQSLELNRPVAGDSTMLPETLEGGAAEVSRVFGEDFEQALRSAPLASWVGPVRSGFGVHLVRVDARTDARTASLAEVRAEVERDWQRSRVQAAQDAYYERLRAKYTVKIEPDTAEPSG